MDVSAQSHNDCQGAECQYCIKPLNTTGGTNINCIDERRGSVDTDLVLHQVQHFNALFELGQGGSILFLKYWRPLYHNSNPCQSNYRRWKVSNTIKVFKDKEFFLKKRVAERKAEVHQWCSWPHLVWPRTEELFSRLFVDQNEIWLVFRSCRVP